MTSRGFRANGLLDWILKKFPSLRWSLVGVLGVEDRSLAAWKVLEQKKKLNAVKLLEIVDGDNPSAPLPPQSTNLTAKRNAFFAGGGTASSILPALPLLSKEAEIVAAAEEFCKNCSENVMLDISSMPKRYFFPWLTVLYTCRSIRNLFVTYTVPEIYDSTLAENAEVQQALPMFNAPTTEPAEKILIVGVGYQLLRLPELIDDMHLTQNNIRLLFPFPSPPPGYQKNWDIVRHINKKLPITPEMIVRVSTNDPSEVFDCILRLTNRGKNHAILAPFGPKPMSLGMCVYAIAKRLNGEAIPAYYTQPLSYSPSYSSGVQTFEGIQQIHTYCLRISGRNLYQIE